jgi:hypothetical protein
LELAETSRNETPGSGLGHNFSQPSTAKTISYTLTHIQFSGGTPRSERPKPSLSQPRQTPGGRKFTIFLSGRLDNLSGWRMLGLAPWTRVDLASNFKRDYGPGRGLWILTLLQRDQGEHHTRIVVVPDAAAQHPESHPIPTSASAA